MFDYLIVGAGLFGATFAERMSARGKRCLVVERRNHIGGNLYTEKIEGIHVHMYGPHIFHTSDKSVWEYVNRFAAFNGFVNQPLANYKCELYHLPFNMHTFEKMWGVRTPDEARAIIAQQRAACGVSEPRNLEEQAISLVGRDIYEKLVKGYTEKQWGRECRHLPAFIIRRLPVRFSYDNNYFSDAYQGVPENGYTAMIEKMLQGCEVRLGVEYLANRRELNALARRVVYTGALDAYFDYALGTLCYRSLRFEREVLDTPDYQGNAVVNYTDRETPFTRVIEHKHFALAGGERTVITREYPAEWKPGDEPYYPINDAENEALAARYRALAVAESNVVFGGRLGEYRYYDMDKVIAAALAAAAQEP